MNFQQKTTIAYEKSLRWIQRTLWTMLFFCIFIAIAQGNTYGGEFFLLMCIGVVIVLPVLFFWSFILGWYVKRKTQFTLDSGRALVYGVRFSLLHYLAALSFFPLIVFWPSLVVWLLVGYICYIKKSYHDLKWILFGLIFEMLKLIFNWFFGAAYGAIADNRAMLGLNALMLVCFSTMSLTFAFAAKGKT